MFLTKKMILSLVSISTLFLGCDSNSNNDTKTTVKEFISLDQRANYEYGQLSIDKNTISLSYVGVLLYKENNDTEYDLYKGLGIFEEDNSFPTIIMSSQDEEMPDFKSMEVNIPNYANGYDCSDITYQNENSTLIEDSEIFIAVAHNCMGKGINKGSVQDINLTLTQSMFIGGTSRIDIVNDKAYLNTEYKIDDNFFLSGGLGTRAYNQIFDLTKNNLEVTTIVEKQISGSLHDDINMQTGRLIRKAGLFTHVESDSDISSGGVDLFCSGKQRTAENGAKFGVHSWSGDGVEAGELSVNDPQHDNQIKYLTEMLGSPTGEEFYFFTINSAIADEIHYMSIDEIEEYKILTN